MEQPIHPSFRPSQQGPPQQQGQSQMHQHHHHPHHHHHAMQQHMQQQQQHNMHGHMVAQHLGHHGQLQQHGHGHHPHPHHPQQPPQHPQPPPQQHPQPHPQVPPASPGGSAGGGGGPDGRPGGGAGGGGVAGGGGGGPAGRVGPPPGMAPGMSPIPMAMAAQAGFPFHHASFNPAVASQGLSPERLRAAALPPAVLTPAQRMPPPLVPMATAFPGFPELARVPGPMQFPGFMFTQEDLDMTLYGYARNKNNEQVPGHALSGLRIGELSYGIDRILGNGSTSLHPSLKSGSASGPIDPSTLDLPEGIELFQTTFAGAVHYGVFCKKTVIAKGSLFGPFRGKQVNTSEIKTNDDNSFMWEIFQDGKLAHFIDGRGSAGNWMAYVNCARYAQEQNLLAVQTDGEIYYEACKDIPQGTELLVWYGDCYLQFMGIPVALKEMADGMQTEEVENSEGYQCERCGKVFAYRYYRDKHLKYTRCVDQGDRKFPCHLCTRSFEKRDRLRIHILHVHEKHRPHKCTVCGKSFSQSSSLNKHMRVHSGERPYKCVYCSKAFTASSILRTHIRQHSGEKPFKCRHCGKAFASHAAHDSHVRRTHTKDKPCVCSVCGKTFSQAYELKFHMNMHNGDTTQPFSCDRCGQRFANPSSRDRHVASYTCCSASPQSATTTTTAAAAPPTAAPPPPPAATGSAHSHMMMDLSRDPMFSGRGQLDINMNVHEKISEEPIDVVGLDTEELMAV